MFCYKSTLFISLFFLNLGAYAQVSKEIKYGSVADIDGNTYKTLQISTQTWMVENLNVSKYNDGTIIPIVTDSFEWRKNFNNYNPLELPMMCWLDNDREKNQANKKGALYNWYAISPTTNGNKNVCPVGWHIPSYEEWMTLVQNIYHVQTERMYRKNLSKYKDDMNKPDYMNSGFFRQLGGYRLSSGAFSVEGKDNYPNWWSSTEHTEENDKAFMSNDLYIAFFLSVFKDETKANYITKTHGFSVRCLKD